MSATDVKRKFGICGLHNYVKPCIVLDMSSQKIAVYTLGENIRKAREDMGWKQSDLAVHVKKSRAAIAGWESNKHRPSALELDRIAEVTNYPIEFFLTPGIITSRQDGAIFGGICLDQPLLDLAA